MGESNYERRGVNISEHDTRGTWTEERQKQATHSFFTQARQTMTVNGVTDVLSFDDSGVYLNTTCGHLSIEGTGLHVTVLNTKDGIVEVTGKLYSLFYDDHEQGTDDGNKHKGKRGFFGRLLS